VKKGYDYIVAGGGSAGCVLEARLSENSAVQVALIEAGPIDEAPEVHTPVAFPQLFKSAHDWDYSTEREPALCGRRIYLPRGKVLGALSKCSSEAPCIPPQPASPATGDFALSKLRKARQWRVFANRLLVSGLRNGPLWERNR
jgi:choline dehydrogenase-like flavoprotein